MHGHTTPRPISPVPTAARIAELSEEWLTADFERAVEIAEEIAGLIAGRVVPIHSRA